MNQQFEFIKLNLKDAYLIKPFISSDLRGAFIKDYNVDEFHRNQIHHELKEIFYTISKRGVLRGIHFQLIKQQAKLVRCLKGEIYDVIIDLRPDSPTFKKWEAFILSDTNNLSIYVPESFGHGYLVINDSIVSYKCSEVFQSQFDSGIKYDDIDLNIDWKFDLINGKHNLILSDKDKNLMSFREFHQVTTDSFYVRHFLF